MDLLQRMNAIPCFVGGVVEVVSIRMMHNVPVMLSEKTHLEHDISKIESHLIPKKSFFVFLF